jgi:hypothetical protein
MRRQLLRDAGLVVLVVGLGVFIAMQMPRHLALAASRNGNPAPPSIPKAPIVYPEIPVRPPTGVPAMHPTRPNQIPAFTLEELRQYLIGTPGVLGNNKPSDVNITRIDCHMRGGDVGGILQRVDTGLSNDISVCYVEFSGTVTYYAPPSLRSPRGTVLTFQTGFRVFDAKTGNLLLTGGLDHPSGSR